MKLLLLTWNWLSGKKTIIAAVGMFIVYGASGMGWLPKEVSDWLIGSLTALGAVGVAHKLVKATK